MHVKRKSLSHVIDDDAQRIIHNLLPVHWVIRPYRPDYGIDLAVELFDKVDGAEGKALSYDTLGEHLFVQVKGTTKLNKAKYKIFKGPPIEKSRQPIKEFHGEIDVLNFSIDTSELLTVHKMGSVTPVMLLIVDINEMCIYFLCLNDYIDKIVLPSRKGMFTQKMIMLKIPITNKITSNSETLLPLYIYSKRPKYYSFFNKVAYQENELNYVWDHSLVDQCQYFAEILLKIDIWGGRSYWPILDKMHTHLLNIVTSGNPRFFNVDATGHTDDEGAIWETQMSAGELYTESEALGIMEFRVLWDSLKKLGNVYEEICREWFLPTMLGTLTR
ncbi:MAG: DUF4365 domain-containing protein [Syntrophobacteraceae bacterium]